MRLGVSIYVAFVVLQRQNSHAFIECYYIEEFWKEIEEFIIKMNNRKTQLKDIQRYLEINNSKVA